MRDEALNDRLRELGVFDALLRVLANTRPALMCSCTSHTTPVNPVPHNRDCALLVLMAQFFPSEPPRPEDRPENVAEFARWVEDILATRKKRTWAEVEFALATKQNRKPDIE